MNMIILNKPYVSDFLIETIIKNDFKVLDNEISRKYLDEKFLISDGEAKNCKLIYSNSENSIDWIADNMPESKIASMIETSKNKALFRKSIKEIYPNYYFEEVSLEKIKTLNPETLKFPIILKPNVGFLSFGVYPIKDKNEWMEVISRLDCDIEKFKNIFPKNVVDTTNFIIEEMIEGDEYALDAYFDENSEAHILNIFHHPFFDDKDVSDRLYYTSKEILEKYSDKFKNILDKIGIAAGYKNFPFHLELRANDKNIIPIELNPMRFCGWCITDIAQNAWGINIYEYFMKQLKPDWKNILKNAPDSYYYFTIADIPQEIEREKIKEIDFDTYLKNISNPLVIRKIDYKTAPIFAIVFAKTNSLDEMKNILKLDMKKFVK